MTITTTPVTTPVLPPKTGLGLPRQAYVSQEIFDLEIEKYFFTTWQYACHESQVAAPGQFVKYRLGPAEIVIIRGRDGKLRALHNTCRHRGAQIVAEESGTCKRSMTCSYHGWAYDLDGTLRGAPKMGPGFDPAQYPMKKAEVEVWNGVVFVHVGGGNPAPVAEALAGVEWKYADIAKSKVAKVVQYELNTNWKGSWENALECYHCAINHPDLARIFDVSADGVEGEGFEGGQEYIFIENTLLPGSISVTPSGQIESKVVYQTKDTGVDRGFLQWHRAAFEMIANPEHVALMTYTPMAPNRSIVTQTFLVPEAAEPGVDFDPDTLFNMHIVTREEDNALCEKIYAGVKNLAYEPGPFNASLEQENFRFLATYRSVMGDAIIDA